jgi:hypothetical protein
VELDSKAFNSTPMAVWASDSLILGGARYFATLAVPYISANASLVNSGSWIDAARVTIALIVGLLAVNQTAFAQADKSKIVHDAEHYILDAQHGEKWAVEDKALDAKLSELRKKVWNAAQHHPHYVGRHPSR